MHMGKNTFIQIKKGVSRYINLPSTTFRDWLLILLAVAFSWVVGAMIQGNMIAIIIAIVLFFVMLITIAILDRKREDKQEKMHQEILDKLDRLIELLGG